jgi:hypothetical protein
MMYATALRRWWPFWQWVIWQNADGKPVSVASGVTLRRRNALHAAGELTDLLRWRDEITGDDDV